MAWDAGTVYGKAVLNTKSWVGGSKVMAGAMKAAMGAVVAVVAIAGAAFIKATKDSQEFLKAFSNVDTIVDETQVDMQKLAKQVMMLDPALGSATDLTKGLYMSFSAGARNAEEAMDLTVTSAKFAKAGLTDIGTSVDAISTAINAYGSETMSAQKAADLFFNTIKLGKVTGAQLASSIGQAIPQFAALGIPLEHLTAGLATMTKQGLSASASTTQLTALTNAFIKPSTAMVAALGETEYASGSALLEAEGLTGALEFLENQTGGNKEAIGELIPNIRGMKAVFALSGEGAEIYTDTLLQMEDASGSLDKAFEEQEKTIDTAKNSFKNLSITVGNLGNTFVNKIAVGASTAAQGMQQFLFSAKGMESVAQFAYIFSGALHTLKAILTPLVTGIMSAYKSMLANIFMNITELVGGAENSNKVFKVMGGIVKVLMTYFSVFAKIINTVVTAIFNLIPVVVSYVKTIGNMISGNYDAALKSGQQFVTSAKKLGTNLKTNIVDIGTTVKDAFNSYGDESDKVASDIEDSWKVSAQGSKDFVLNNYDELLTGQSAFAKSMKEQRDEAEEEAQVSAKEAGDNIAENAEASGSSFSDVWVEVFENLEDLFSEDFTASLFEKAGTSILSASSTMMGTVGDAMGEYYDGEIDSLTAYYDDRLAVTESYWDDELTASTEGLASVNSDLYNQELDYLADLYDQKIITEEEYLVNQLALQNTYGQSTISSQSELDDILANESLSAEEKQAFAEEYYANQSVALEAQKEEELATIDAEAAEKKNAIEEKAFKAEQAQAISQVWMDALSAQLGYVSWAAPIGPWAWIAAAAMGTTALVTAGVQTAQIAGESYTPSYNTGTLNHPGGLAIIGDKPSGQGGELTNIPRGTSVTPTIQTKELMDTMNGLSNMNNVGQTTYNNYDFTGADFGTLTQEQIEALFDEKLNEAISEVV